MPARNAAHAAQMVQRFGGTAFAALLLLANSAGPSLAAETPAKADLPDSATISREIGEQFRGAIVRVERWDGDHRGDPVRRSTGTGFFVEEAHPQAEWIIAVVPEWVPTDFFRIEIGRNIVPAKIVARDPESWLTLLSVEAIGNRVAVKLASKSPADPGCRLFFMDARTPVGGAASLGRLACREPMGRALPSLLRVNGPAETGSGGAPIFNAHQSVVGLIFRPIPGVEESLLAVPVEWIARFLDDVKRYGRPVHPWLGIVVNDSVAAPRIEGRKPDSPAQDSGIEPGDIVLALDGHEISSLQQLIDTSSLLEVDHGVEIKVLRGQDIRTMTITPRIKR